MIGFPADLSTDWAYYDSPMEEGAQFAVDQINDERRRARAARSS